MDLRQLVWGANPWGCRRLIAHIIGIPPHNSALARKRLGNAANWDTKTELQATTVDALNALIHVVIKAAGGTPPDIESYPRPFDLPASEPVETAGLAEFADFLKG